MNLLSWGFNSPLKITPILKRKPISLFSKLPLSTHTFNPNGFQDTVTSNAAKNELDYSVDFFGTEELYNSSGIRLVSQTMI